MCQNKQQQTQKRRKENESIILNFGIINYGELHIHTTKAEETVNNNVSNVVVNNQQAAANAGHIIEAIKLMAGSLKYKRDFVSLYKIIQEGNLMPGLTAVKFCKIVSAIGLSHRVLPNADAFKQIAFSNEYPNWVVNDSEVTTRRFLNIANKFIEKLKECGVEN